VARIGKAAEGRVDGFLRVSLREDPEREVGRRLEDDHEGSHLAGVALGRGAADDERIGVGLLVQLRPDHDLVPDRHEVVMEALRNEVEIAS
jgi:hypothetical protein